MKISSNLSDQHNLHRDARSGGFTLVEISMVLLLFASAIGGLLSFFPVGLRMEANAISDSAQTMFALDVLGQIEANANAITDWNVWNDNDKFCAAILKGIRVNDDKSSISPKFKHYKLKSEDNHEDDVYRSDDEGTLIEAYLTDRANMRYVLQVSPVETPIYFGRSAARVAAKDYRLRRVTIWATDRRDADPYMSAPFTVYLTFNPSIDSIMKGGAI